MNLYLALRGHYFIQERKLNHKGENVVMLPLLKQNMKSFSMQKHCIKIMRAAAEVINPGQVTVDVNDQPVYAALRQLQENYPNEFDPGYLPMFGGLHIEM